MKRLTWMYSALLGAVLGTTGCDQLQVCEDGLCIDIDICNPMVENCGEVDTGDESPCPEGEIVATEGDCLADGFCYGLPDGRFCTGGAQLSCPVGFTLDTMNLCEEGEGPLCFIYAEGAACRLTAVYTIDECRALDAIPSSDPGDGSLLRAGCPDGQQTLGYISADWDEGGLCCRGEPVQEPCAEGEIVDDAGDCLMDDAFCYELPDGRFCTGPDAPQCPEGYRPDYEGRCDIADNGICFTYSEGLDCYLDRFYTVEECTELGGEPIREPGDGSVVTVGCSDGRAALAYLDADWIEGGLCCAWLPD